MSQLLSEFLAGADDLTEALFADLQALREKYGEGRARRELTGRIFRHVHTLKGTAAAAGLDVVSQIAHGFETLLDGVRSGRVAINDAVLDAFDDAAQALSQTLGAAARVETLQLPLPLLENLRRLARSDEHPASHHSVAQTLAFLPEEIASSLGADDARRLHEARTEGQRLLMVNITFPLATFDKDFRALSAALGHSGELIQTMPGAAEAALGAINFRLLYAAAVGAEELRSIATPFGPVIVEELLMEAVKQYQSGAEQVDEESKEQLDEESNFDSAFVETITPLTTQVRVELGKVDDLISAAHELQKETITTLALALADNAANDQRRHVEARAALIHRRFIELEEQLIGLRRVPLEQTLARAARAGRQAARALGKDVSIEIAGGEVQLDKALIEAINGPLLHLVRNAVGHGIGTAEERIGAGKNTRGTVRLEASADGDRVNLKITDDGQGIDFERIARAAIERGLVAAGQTISHHQALRLIFRPGFSTAPEVSEVSGRGVGLDVVERAIEQVGGEIRVRSQTNQGTTFELIVPTALALCSARIVASAGFSYCVDARQVSEIGLIAAPALIKRSGDEELIDWRGAKLPLIRLRELLGQPFVATESTERAESLTIVILAPAKSERAKEFGAGARSHVALLVDDCAEEGTEVLVRRLGAHALRWPGISGAAELSDGQLALVLDLPRLLETYWDGR